FLDRVGQGQGQYSKLVYIHEIIDILDRPPLPHQLACAKKLVLVDFVFGLIQLATNKLFLIRFCLISYFI
ncbi:MAG: hypothetical protein AAGH90_13140, partial [Pseudomonadota bacterium]